MRFVSILVSLLLHGGIVLLGMSNLFLGAPTRVNLDRQVYEVDLVQAPSQPAASATSSSTPPPASEEKTEAPQAAPQRKAPSASEAKKKPAAGKKISAKKASQPKAAKKKPDTAKAKAEKVEAKREKPEAKPQPKSAPEAPTPESVVADALRDVSEEAQSQEANATRNTLRSEVEALRASLEGSGQDGEAVAGAVEVYAAVVEQTVKAQWRYAALGSTEALRARVILRINSQGTITDVQLRDRSGNDTFDRSVLRAVEDTGTLPPPPNNTSRQVSITFNLQAKE